MCFQMMIVTEEAKEECAWILAMIADYGWDEIEYKINRRSVYREKVPLECRRILSFHAV